jgi:serine protease Do
MDVERVFAEVAPAVVGVEAGPGMGSGFFIDPRGLCVTNRHVVGSEVKVILSLPTSIEVRAKVVRSLRSLDLAFLLAECPAPAALGFADPESIKVGQEVIAIGHPRGLANTVTRGIVSSLGRLIRGTHYLQTDAAINPGNSGGPILNHEGQVVGMSTMVMANAHGIGFAVPSGPIRDAAAEVCGRFGELPNLRYCNVCGQWSPPEEKYCGVCGDSFKGQPVELDRMRRSLATTLPMAVREWMCAACKQVGKGETRYCPRCGATVESAVQTAKA